MIIRCPECGMVRDDTDDHLRIADVRVEVARALSKFPTWPTDPLHALAVLGEEYGELMKAVLQQVYEPHKNPTDAVREEAVQVAAMALRFLASLDTYQYQACPQHAQGPASNAAGDPAGVVAGSASTALLDAKPSNGEAK
jgi:NTP pyrophosphatase (non-canonical NTP hydrolase)